MRDALTRELRAQILSGALAPGVKLPEEDVARRYGVARPTARQAIHDLVFEGLLRRQPNRSAEVPVLSTEDVREIFAIRELIEAQGIGLLAGRSEVPEEMTRQVELLDDLSDGDWAAAVQHDQNFHAALVDSLQNRRLSRMYASVQAENRLCLAQERYAYTSVKEVANEHRALLNAIASGMPERAVKLLRAHLREAMDRLVARPAGGASSSPSPPERPDTSEREAS